MEKWKIIIQKHKKAFWCIAGIIVLAVAAIGILKGSKLPFLFSGEAKNGELELAEAQNIADTENFHFKINARPVFDNGESKGSLMIINPRDNGYNMQVTIMLDDSEKEVYTSCILVPGNQTSYDKLNEVLEKGDYPATAVFDILDLKTNESVGQVSAGLQISIKN